MIVSPKPCSCSTTSRLPTNIFALPDRKLGPEHLAFFVQDTVQFPAHHVVVRERAIVADRQPRLRPIPLCGLALAQFERDVPTLQRLVEGIAMVLREGVLVVDRMFIPSQIHARFCLRAAWAYLARPTTP